MSLLFLLAFIIPADGPVVGPNPRAEWSQSVESPNNIANYSWKYYLDGAGLGAVFTDVICQGGTEPEYPKHYTCDARLPVTIPGQHQIYIITTNTVGSEIAHSDPSPTAQFYVAVPGLDAPNTIVIKKKEDK